MKYMGSKSRLVKDLVPILEQMMDDNNINVFVDAFCGGCSIVSNIDNRFSKIANDKQKYLIAMLKGLVNDNVYPHTINREFYNEVRNSYNTKDGKYEDDLIGWVGFMASYNGRFFDGGYSGHHVLSKSGKERDYITEQINNTLKGVELLKNVQFHSVDYSELPLTEKSLIYCDIPYNGTKQYTTSKNFDYERFYKWCYEMKSKGHIVVVSEYEMPSNFRCIWSKEITNAMHQTNTKKPIEKLFVL